MNLLKNPNFDQGHHHQDNVPEIVAPNDWRLDWIDNEIFKGAESPAYRPESVVWDIIHAPAHEKLLFFLAGNYCWKIFKANAPVYYAASQIVTGLTPGTTYRFNAQVFPDIVTSYSAGKKMRPGDIWSAESRAGWSDPGTPWPRGEDGDVNWSEWFNKYNQNFEFGKYNNVFVEFTAPASGQVRVWVECKAKWGFENNWFMDAFTLEAVDGSGDEVPPTPPSPAPTPPSDSTPIVSESEGRGAPRVQYNRTYILLPTNISPEMALVALKVAQANQATVGFSPDDAGIGDLDMRRILCVSPEKIGTGLDQTWYDTYYPGTLFVPVSFANSTADLENQLKQLF